MSPCQHRRARHRGRWPMQSMATDECLPGTASINADALHCYYKQLFAWFRQHCRLLWHCSNQFSCSARHTATKFQLPPSGL